MKKLLLAIAIMAAACSGKDKESYTKYGEFPKTVSVEAREVQLDEEVMFGSPEDIIIDGKGGTAGEGERVIRDRQIMSKNGAVIIVLRAYSDSKRLVGDPDILTRGLIYGSEQEVITKEVIERTKKAYNDALSRGDTERKALKKAVTSALFRYFDRKLSREPMVVPIIVEV